MDEKEVIRRFVGLELLNDGGGGVANLRDSDSLIESGVIDSLGIMKLLAFLEDTFDIQISDDALVPENFETIEAISLMVGNGHSQ